MEWNKEAGAVKISSSGGRRSQKLVGIKVSNLVVQRPPKVSKSTKRASPLGNPAFSTPLTTPLPFPKQGAKPAEVYGFVGSIVSVVAYILYVLWAFLPEPWLHAVGVTYYPSRYWAIALPTYVPVAVLFCLCVYTSLNMMSTQPLQSLSCIRDKHTRETSMSVQTFSDRANEELKYDRSQDSDPTGERRAPIPPISDLPIEQVSLLLYGPGSDLHRQLCRLSKDAA